MIFVNSLYSKHKLEMHPGNYIFYDISQKNIGSCKEEEIASFVIASVIGVYKERESILIDAGKIFFLKKKKEKKKK